MNTVGGTTDDPKMIQEEGEGSIASKTADSSPPATIPKNDLDKEALKVKVNKVRLLL